VPVTAVTLASGERADVVIDFAAYLPGATLLLVNDAPAPFPGTPGVGVVPEVLEFRVVAGTGHTAPLPPSLRPLPPLDEGTAAAVRDFELRKASDPCTGQVWLINGLGWDDITERPELGTTEVWRFVNRSGVMHPMHMHLVLFQVLDRQAFDVQDGAIVPVGPRVPPPPEEAGWKDTVRVGPSEIVRVIARFDDYKGKYPYHCHILEHEDHEMMRQFETVLCGDGEVDPGEECGETGLGPCQSGLLCVGCLCRARGDCSVDGTAVDLFDVLSQIDLVLGRFTPRPAQTVLCDDDCDGDIDLFDVLTGIDVVLGRRSLPLECPSVDAGRVGQ
jgi:hypothetical protein